MIDAGVKVRPYIMRHYSNVGLRESTNLFYSDVALRNPLFRGRFILSRIAGDIPRIRERFDRAVRSKWIVPNVTEWNILPDEQGSTLHRVQVLRANGQEATLDKVSKIYALIGYQNDTRMMDRCGIGHDHITGEIYFEVTTGRIRSDLRDGGGRFYVAGAAAARHHDRNHEVIPGMMRTLPWIAFSEVVAANAKKAR